MRPGGSRQCAAASSLLGPCARPRTSATPPPPQEPPSLLAQAMQDVLAGEDGRQVLPHERSVLSLVRTEDWFDAFELQVSALGRHGGAE